MIGVGSVATILNPYLTYIKIAALVIAASAVIGASCYVWYVVQDRSTLKEINGRLNSALTAEQDKYFNLMQQTNQIMEMNQKIVEAVKRVKINSSIYIDKVEAAKLAVPAAGGTVLVPGGMSKALPANSSLPIFQTNSSNRSATKPAGS